MIINIVFLLFGLLVFYALDRLGRKEVYGEGFGPTSPGYRTFKLTLAITKWGMLIIVLGNGLAILL